MYIEQQFHYKMNFKFWIRFLSKNWFYPHTLTTYTSTAYKWKQMVITWGGYYGMFWSAAYSLTQNVVQRRIFWHVLVSCVQSHKERCPEKCLSKINSPFCLLQNILIHKINIQVTQLIFTLSWQLNSIKSSLQLTAASVLVNSSVSMLNLLLPSYWNFKQKFHGICEFNIFWRFFNVFNNLH
jgi:hypothetical protein